MAEEHSPTPGFKWFDQRSSPIRLVTCVDHPNILPKKVGAEDGDIVYIPGKEKVYGPYRLVEEFARGNGEVSYKAYALGTNKKNGKSMNKAELEQFVATQAAEMEVMRQKLQRLEGTKK